MKRVILTLVMLFIVPGLVSACKGFNLRPTIALVSGGENNEKDNYYVNSVYTRACRVDIISTISYGWRNSRKSFF